MLVDQDESGHQERNDTYAAVGGAAEIIQVMPSPPQWRIRVVIRTTLIAYTAGVICYLVCINFAGQFAPELRRVFRMLGWTSAILPFALYLFWRLLHWSSLRGWNRLREQFGTEYPVALDNPLSRAAGEHWEYGLVPNYQKMAKVLAEYPRPASSTRIVCLGLTDVPSVDLALEEPLIVRPASQRAIIVCGVFALMCMMHFLFFLVVGAMAPGLTVFEAIVFVPFGSVWVYCVLLCPRYVRIAPGVIQVFRYGFLSGRPRVREWRLRKNAVVFLRCLPKSQAQRVTSKEPYSIGARESWTITLAVNDGHGGFCVSIDNLKIDERLRLCRLLLSGSPTPPLSMDELVG